MWLLDEEYTRHPFLGVAFLKKYSLLYGMRQIDWDYFDIILFV
jgi:hypothetical protein